MSEPTHSATPSPTSSPAAANEPAADASAAPLPSGPGLAPGALGSPEKDPADWVTGDEPLTGAQASYLETLARQAGEEVPAGLTKAQASEHIDRLQALTGRGKGA